jgi:hypothetical protein
MDISFPEVVAALQATVEEDMATLMGDDSVVNPPLPEIQRPPSQAALALDLALPYASAGSDMFVSTISSF